MKANLEVVSSKKQSRIGMILMGMMMFAVMLSLVLIAPNNLAKADAGDDTFDKAVALKANEPVVSSLSSNEDINWYKFVIPDSIGIQQLVFQSMNLEMAERFKVILYKEKDGFPTEEIFVSSSFMPAPESYSSFEISYPKGTVLYVKVLKDRYSPEGIEYKLTFKTSAEPEKDCIWAKEDDVDNVDNADILIGGKKFCGLINHDNDSDWFKYVVKSEDTFRVIFKNTNLELGERFQVLVYTEENGMPKDVVCDSGIFIGAPESFTTSDLSYPKGTVLYVKVKHGRYDSRGIRYILWVEDKAGAGSDKVSKLEAPYSVLADTNVIVGKAEAGATVYAKYGKKTYSAVAGEDGIYRIVAAKLGKGKSVKMWQKVGKKTSAKQTIKVVAKY